MFDNTLNDSELFKSTFLENNQNWNHSPLDSFPSPSSYLCNNEEDEIIPKNNRVHSRHFSANDSQCIRNTFFNSPTSSPPFLLQQQHQQQQQQQQEQQHQQQADVVTAIDQKRRLRFDIILEAATAVTQKAEESAITYLNRGQNYGIQLNDKQGSNEIITSTLSIAFHSSSHRRIAESYWKFWISQQKQTNARAIDLDSSQSTGISEVTFPSFDKITFNWNGSYGAKVFIRFKCLSTDFSRIKGVKGIPLRAQMESYIEEKDKEVCFCKVKLFRDKGAERKNKDDAKQISKQLEKVYGKANEQSLPLMYNVSLPYSVFGEIPTATSLDSFEHATTDDLLALQQQKTTKTPARYHTRVMTAPLFYNRNMKGRKSISSILPPFSQQQHNTPLVTQVEKENEDFRQYLTEQQQALAALPHIDTSNLQHNSPPPSSVLMHHFPLDDTPPLIMDALPTPCTAQATPTDFGDIILDNFTTNNTIMTTSFNQPSIYDIFTPEEIQQPPESCSISPTREKDYFCDNNITILQQQLQLHNETASHIMSNNNNNTMLLLSPPNNDDKRSKKRKNTSDSRILTYSTNPSHLTFNMIKLEDNDTFLPKKVRYDE